MQGIEAELPTLVECDTITHNKNEIPTPEIAKEFSHLKGVVKQISELDLAADIEILIGRDTPELLKVRDFKNRPTGFPGPRS